MLRCTCLHATRLSKGLTGLHPTAGRTDDQEAGAINGMRTYEVQQLYFISSLFFQRALIKCGARSTAVFDGDMLF